MTKHEVVNEIIEFLDVKRTELSNAMSSVQMHSNNYMELDSMYSVYDYLIAKLGDDYR
jgi:hypothetical protein